MRFLALDCDMGEGVEQARFDGDDSLFDYGAIFWDPAISLNTYDDRYSGTYRGRTSLSEHKSSLIRRDVERRRLELSEFLNLGRIIVTFLPGDTTIYAKTGERTYSGTGRNRQTTNIVSEFDIMQALPIKLELAPGTGVEMESADPRISSFFRKFGGQMQYLCSIVSAEPEMERLLQIKGSDRAVGALYRSPSGGMLILLPQVYDTPEEEPGTESDDLNVDKQLRNWVLSLTGVGESESQPSWVSDLAFPSEASRLREIEDLERSASDLAIKIDELRARQAGDTLWKTLIFGSGDPLERQVAAALKELGFEVGEVTPGRTDIRAVRNGVTLVAEVKGVSKSSAEKHAAQLEKWVAEEFSISGKNPKGILVVSGWRDVPLLERSRPTFPAQMIPYAEQRGHCLATGLQVLSIARTVMESPERADELANLLLGTIGVLDGWDDPLAIFEQSTQAVAVKTDSAGPDQQAVENSTAQAG